MGVFVTGTGVISAIGTNTPENLYALQHQLSGIKSGELFPGMPPVFAGKVGLTDRELMEQLAMTRPPVSRTSLLGIRAAKEAWGGNVLLPALKTGLISATSVGGMDRSEVFYQDFLQGLQPDYGLLSCHDSGSTSERIAAELGITGYVNTLSTACSSGVNAIMLGARLLQSGRLDRVLVGGTDSLTRFTVSGFEALMIYDAEWCRPFDESRAGLNLGEGAAFLLLENEKSLSETGNEVLCMVSGWSNAADAYHQTASSPDGKGATLAISEAIQKAGLHPSDISYINVHGTGTRNNDQSESVALQAVFGAAVPAFSSTKAYTGHTLAAAGAIESVFSVMALRHQCVFPTLNFSKPMEGTGLVPVTEPEARKVTAVLSNSFGFGGNNSSIVFTQYPS